LSGGFSSLLFRSLGMMVMLDNEAISVIHERIAAAVFFI
jgi:hypothetical protein